MSAGPRDRDNDWAIPGARHPLLRRITQLQADAAELATYEPAYLTTAEKAEALVALTAAVEAVEVARLRMLAVSADVATDAAARDAGAWLAATTRIDGRGARRMLRLGKELRDWDATSTALSAGVVTVDQAAIIVKAMRALQSGPVVPSVETIALCEEKLIELSGLLSPAELGQAAERVLDLVAPEIAEEALRRRVERDEANALAKTKLTTSVLEKGVSRVTITLPTTAKDRLLTYLQAFTQPCKVRDDGSIIEPWQLPDPKQTYPEQLGHGFLAMLEAWDPKRTPLHGGDATTIIVTVPLQQLQDGVGAVSLTTGGHLSIGETRRLACTAGIIPAVLGGNDQILNLGTARRLFSPAQRKALALKHPVCAVEGCDIPSSWCDAHHQTPWSHGGPTDLTNGVLLCRRHHKYAHDNKYERSTTSGGAWKFHRRP